MATHWAHWRFREVEPVFVGLGPETLTSNSDIQKTEETLN